MPIPGVPGHLALGQLGPGTLSAGGAGGVGSPGRERRGARASQARLLAQAGKGLAGLPAEKLPRSLAPAPGQAQQRTEATAHTLSRAACSGLAQPFPWHRVLLSQQPQDGRALGSAAGCRREIDFLVGPGASTFLKACPQLGQLDRGGPTEQGAGREPRAWPLPLRAVHRPGRTVKAKARLLSEMLGPGMPDH